MTTRIGCRGVDRGEALDAARRAGEVPVADAYGPDVAERVALALMRVRMSLGDAEVTVTRCLSRRERGRVDRRIVVRGRVEPGERGEVKAALRDLFGRRRVTGEPMAVSVRVYAGA